MSDEMEEIQKLASRTRLNVDLSRNVPLAADYEITAGGEVLM